MTDSPPPTPAIPVPAAIARQFPAPPESHAHPPRLRWSTPVGLLSAPHPHPPGRVVEMAVGPTGLLAVVAVDEPGGGVWMRDVEAGDRAVVARLASWLGGGVTEPFAR